ncbi:ornithine cyclodeaminase family protein [Halorubrum sp. 48-1-W]|uniref:ornithine cyclodeaminase family protein n=1 Tax=Halorubrum sp. 48-1-W TaxID=2249761 RepID=UPI000DCB7E9C|nr:ornithine cyclodeaminase family protein [Halorubrum sp. 48-1-W]RAW46950.1 ornithine cyclodeaminase family protein [Halorubrum sp. 48-1-W]
MVLVLSAEEVERSLDLAGLVDVVNDALVKQAAGEVERPHRPHFPVGTGLDGEEPAGTGIAMPAYVHGAEHYATKLVGVHEGNADRGLPTINAQIALTDARTGLPKAFMAGTTITNARTGCIGAVSVRELAPKAGEEPGSEPDGGGLTLGVIGAGAQARWQTRAIATVAALSDVRVHSPSDSREACATDLSEEGIPARAVDTPRTAVEGADVVVTATTATEPVFPPDALDPGTLVVAVGAFTEGMQELHPDVLDRAERVFADVPAEVAETGDLLASDLDAEDLVELGVPLADGYDRASPDGVLVVVSVGSATLDAAAGETVYRDALEAGDGTEVSL